MHHSLTAWHACGCTAGMMQPRLLDDGQVCVDMGPPTLAAAQVPTTLPATRDNGAAVAAELQVTPAQRQRHLAIANGQWLDLAWYSRSCARCGLCA